MFMFAILGTDTEHNFGTLYIHVLEKRLSCDLQKSNSCTTIGQGSNYVCKTLQIINKFTLILTLTSF